MLADPEARWRRLLSLLAPIHGQAAATARRLSRSDADGDDLYQETVLRAFEKLHTLRDESRFRSWFYATLLNRHRTRHRRSFWHRFLPWEEAFPDGDGPVGEAGEDRQERAQQALRVARALATLPAEQREAVVLFEVDGYPIEEIASMQRSSVPAVKSRLARGRERLRQWYQRHAGPALRSAAGVARDASAARVPAGKRVQEMEDLTPLTASPPVKERNDE
jgi:RNA polymerase sigma-70 factor (ECF subfamily)